MRALPPKYDMRLSHARRNKKKKKKQARAGGEKSVSKNFLTMLIRDCLPPLHVQAWQNTAVPSRLTALASSDHTERTAKKHTSAKTRPSRKQLR